MAKDLENMFFPGQIVPQRKVISHKGKHYLILSATIAYDYKKSKVLVPAQLGKYRANMVKPIVDDGLIPDIDDFGFPKPCGEWMLYGECYSEKSGKEKGVEVVSVRLAEQEKEVVVFGNRMWKEDVNFDSQMSDPESFSVMPLTPARAYGGEGNDINPKGMGAKGDLLPHLENLNKLIVEKKDAPMPAFFCALDTSSSLRNRHMGTCDMTWHKNVRPAYPDDMDWLWFNRAPLDQRIKGFFRGDEPFELYKLHPDEKEIRSSLPGYLTRFFYTKSGGDQLHELSSRLDSVTFFSTLSLVCMTWRGVLEVDDYNADDIGHIVMAYEKLTDIRRNLDYYQKDFNWRKVESITEPLYIQMITGSLVPDWERSYQRILFEDALEESEGAPLADHLLSDHEEILEAFTNPKPLKDIDVMRGKIEASADTAYKEGQAVGGYALAQATDRQFKKVQDAAENSTKHLQERLSDLRSGSGNTLHKLRDLEVAVPEEEKDMVNEVEAIVPNYITKPLRVNADLLVAKNIDKIQSIMEKHRKRMGLVAANDAEERLRNIRVSLAQNATYLNSSAEAKKMLAQVDEQLYEIDQQREALLQDKPPKVKMVRCDSDGIFKQLQDKLQEAKDQVAQIDDAAFETATASQKAKFARLKELAGDDGAITAIMPIAMDEAAEAMSSMKDSYRKGAHLLPEGIPHHNPADAKSSFLELWQKNKKDVSKGDYACVDFSGMDLSGTNFSDCYLEQTNFSGCNLVGCNFTNAILPRAILSDANLQGSKLTGANFGAVIGERVNFIGVVLNEETQFSECRLQNVEFNGADFSQLMMQGVRFLYSKFLNCRFDKTMIQLSLFTGSDFNGSRFHMSPMVSTSFEEAILVNTFFSRCDFARCFFHKVDFSNSRLESCSLIANVDDSKAKGGMHARFDYASLKNCTIVDLNLSHTSFKHARLDTCCLMNSIFEGCDFSFAIMPSLYAGEVNFEGSSFERAEVMDIDFMGSNLRSVNFRNANLFGAELVRTKIGRADFTGAILDNTIMEDWRPSK